MVKCLLSLKFGKDIAGLVNWWAWKIGLTSVHEEIASTFKCTFVYKPLPFWLMF